MGANDKDTAKLKGLSNVSIRVIRPVVSRLAAKGMSTRPILLKAGLNENQLRNDDERIDHQVAIKLWKVAAEKTNDKNFGLHVAQDLVAADLDVQSYAFFSARTLGEGIAEAFRIHRLQHQQAKLTLTKNPKDHTAIMHHELPGNPPPPRHVAEFIIASWLRLMREGTGRALMPRAVRFMHGAPNAIDEHKRFFGVNPIFSAPHTELEFNLEVLDYPQQQADHRLSVILRKHADRLLAELPQNDALQDQVKRVVLSHLAQGHSTEEETAKQLRLSVRTLRRKLREEGTSFRKLTGEARCDLAKQYLRANTYSLKEIAFFLGYSEPSAFQRAFKRWTGRSPHNFRRSRQH